MPLHSGFGIRRIARNEGWRDDFPSRVKRTDVVPELTRAIDICQKHNNLPAEMDSDLRKELTTET